MADARRALSALGLCLAATFALPTGESAAQTTAPPDGWVVLPIDEYRDLRNRALGAPPPDSGPPVDATLTRIDYDLQSAGEIGNAAVGRALLAIDVLRDGWTRVSIPAGLMVREARLDGDVVSLLKGPPPHVLVQRAGRHILQLDIVVPVVTAGGGEALALPASPSPISRVTLRVPRTGVELTAANGFVIDRAERTTESQWTLLGRSNQPLTLTWRRRLEDQRADQPLRTRSRITQFVGLGEDGSQVTASVRIDVVQGLAPDVTLAIPPSLVINQVTGATVADWEVSGGVLRVRLLEPAGADVSFVLHGESRTPRDGLITVPLVRMPSAERESGGVALDVVGAGELSGQIARGLDPVDPAELGDIVSGRQSPSMMAFRLRPTANPDASLSVTLVRYTPQTVLIANVEEARYRALATDDGHLLVEAKYAIRNNQRSFLKVSLPDQATVWTAAVRGRRIHPGKAEASSILLPLDKGRANEEAPTFVVELVYIQPLPAWADKGRVAIPLPVIDLPISRTGLEVRHSPRFRVEPQPGPFRVGEDIGPFAEAFRPHGLTARGGVGTGVGGVVGGVIGGSTAAGERAAAMPGAAPPAPGAAASLQSLVNRFNQEAGGRTVLGALPVPIAFPEFGPSIFLVSELTPEAHPASVELAYRKR
jgi:hypothetical protein